MSRSFKSKQDRLDRLVGLLKSDSAWTCSILSEMLETSHRTLMRDLDHLREIGYPIETERGRGGGVRLTGQFGLGRLALSNQEILGLLMSLAVTETLNPPLLSSHIKSARQKIGQTFPDHQRKQLQRLRARILVGSPASEAVLSSYSTPFKAVVSSLNSSFYELRKLKITYTAESNKTTVRVIEPQIILLNWPVWYLAGWDHLRDSPRLFRIDRISKAVALDDQFSLRPERVLKEGFSKYFSQL